MSLGAMECKTACWLRKPFLILRGISRENNTCNKIKSGEPSSISRGLLRENNAYNKVQLSRAKLCPQKQHETN